MSLDPISIGVITEAIKLLLKDGYNYLKSSLSTSERSDAPIVVLGQRQLRFPDGENLREHPVFEQLESADVQAVAVELKSLINRFNSLNRKKAAFIEEQERSTTGSDRAAVKHHIAEIEEQIKDLTATIYEKVKSVFGEQLEIK